MADKIKKNHQEYQENFEKNVQEYQDNFNETVENQTENVETAEETPESISLGDIIKLKEENDALKVENEKLSKEAVDNKDNWYRTAAEFENFKKRNSETRRTAYSDGKKDSILQILVIGDSLDRALEVEMDEQTKNGVMLIVRQFKETLSALGVEEINPIGEDFNPETSEAIATLPCEEGEEPNKVKTVFKKGYKLDGRIIRYCQVVVTQ